MDGAATVLARMTHLVSTHQPRLLRAVGAALDEADKLPATPAPPCHADTLAQLCESFGINTEYQRSGKVGVGNDKLLYDARRLLVMLQKSLSVDEILVPPPVGQWSGTESGAPLSSSVGQAFAGMAGDMSLTNSADSDADNPTDPLKVVRCYWLAAVTLIPEVPSWQTAQTAALPVSEPLPMAMRAVMQAFYGDATQVAQMATYLAAVDAKEKRGGDLDKSSLAALYILQNTKAVLLKAQLVELLNFFRSVQRHLALSAANLLPTSPANLSSPDYNNDELQPFAHLDPPRQGQSVIDLSMPLGAADIGAPVHCPALGPNRSSERSDQAVADQCRGVDIRDSTRWIGGRESHWTRDQPISPSPSEGMTPRSVKLRCVRNGLGTRVLHQVVIADLHTLVVEVAATASHFEHARHKAGKEHVIPQRNSLRRASSAKAIDLMKRQAEFDDQAAEDCAWIAQLITDTMALRPRLDLDALSCDDAYASSTLVLRLKTTLLHRVLGHHVQAVETHMAALQHYSEATRLRRDSERFSTPADRRCASIALQIEARLRALVVELEKSVEKALRNDLPPVMYTRMEALILMQASNFFVWPRMKRAVRCDSRFWNR
ncbi:hypothetical protein AB1Y20_019032 [Prymnesium parvum]|uniref:Nuclear pore protein n=1 Tax=Prymnesium parvum TaxID=97485 RepID=A0AB34JTB5_PRYPA